MWQRLEFKNFKSLRDVSLELERLTVLVGPNGAGKSSVLQGAELLAGLTVAPPVGVDPGQLIAQRFAPDGPLGPTKLMTRGVDPHSFTELMGSIVPGRSDRNNDLVRLQLHAKPAGRVDARPSVEVECNNKGGPVTQSYDGDARGTVAALELATLDHGPAMKLALNAAALARPSYVDEENARIRQDGYGLPSMIAAMAATDRSRLDRLEQALHDVVPRARRIRAPRAKVTRTETQIITVAGNHHTVDTARDQVGNRLEVEMQGVGWLDASLLSDGTLIALGILALLHAETCPKLLLIDDLDHSLHPRAYGELVAALREVMNQNPTLQLLCTTHAPYLLDCFQPEEVRVLSLDSDGYTHAVKLVDHPEWSEKMRGSLSTGEFWSTVGEQWATLNGHG